MPLIFIVDDDVDTLFSMEFWLKRKGYGVKAFATASQMLHQVKTVPPDIVLLDVNLNGEDGRDICMRLKVDVKIDRPVFLISSFKESCSDYQRYHADGFMEKPYHMKELPAMIQSKLA